MTLDWLDNLESIFKEKIEEDCFIPFFFLQIKILM